MNLDIMAFGAHPDDVEIGLGGTLIKHTTKGYRCGVVDLTAGETGTNGTADIRRKEALRAAEIMGVEVRECLGLPDARLQVNEESLRVIIEVIRRYRPKVVMGSYHLDRHPDHLRASQLVREAAYLSGLRKYPAEGEAHRPSVVAQYFLGHVDEPTFIVDISEHYERKMGALNAHESQFGLPADTQWGTLVNHPGFMSGLQSRDQYMGSRIQAAYGEGIYIQDKQPLEDLTTLKGRRRREAPVKQSERREP